MFKKKDTLQDIDLLVDVTEATVQKTVDDKGQTRYDNVVILGHESRTASGQVWRRYTDACLTQSVNVFEGIAAYADHPEGEAKAKNRSVRDMFGFYSNVRADLNEHKVRGSLTIFGHELGQHIASIIEGNPKVLGNSIRASGKVTKVNGIEICEAIFPRTIHGAKSGVDLVTDPATTKMLFESKNSQQANGKETKSMEFSDLTVVALTESRPDLVKKLTDEGAASKAQEIKTLTEQVATLTAEKTKSKNDLDALQVKVQMMESRQVVDQLLAESPLPANAKTDVFKNMLYNLTESKTDDKVVSVKDQATSLIEDRCTTLGIKVTGVKNNGTDKKPLGGANNDAPAAPKNTAEILEQISTSKIS